MENRIRRFQTADQQVKPGPGSAGIWVNSDGELSYSTLIDGVEEVFTVNTLEGDPINIDGGAIEDVTISGEVDIDMSDPAAVLVLPQADSPAQTDEGSIVWDADSDLLTVGDGASRKVMVDTTSTQTLAGKTLTTPDLGVATATSVNKVTITAPATAATLTLVDGTTVTGPPATGTLATLAGSETLTNKTLTSPIVNGATGTGQTITKTVTFAETALGVSHVATIALPAGSTLLGLTVAAGVLWGATTSATLKVGDTADDDGYFIGVDLKATDLLVGEVLDINVPDNWGGVEGAYLVAATGQRGPAATNFGNYYAAGTNILATVTVVDPVSTAGRTYLTITYAVGTTVAPVVS